MRGFWSNRDGNIAITFALMLIPLLGFVGVALDYSMATAYRTDLQKALDATALALTKIMPADQATLDTVGNQYFQANLGPHSLTNLQLTVTPNVGTLRVSVKGTYNVQLASIIGATSVELGARSEAKWSIGKVEVVLALDNTGSMSGDKIAKLKEGAQKLVDILKNAVKEEGDARIGIVPYTVQVKVDPVTHASATWWRDGYCSKSQYKTQNSCTNNDGTWRSTNSGSWTGCIADRDRKDSDNDSINHDVKDTEPTSDGDTKFPRASANSNRCPAATILPLTDVYNSDGYDALTNKINAMQAVGNTNVTVGAVWGWHLLDDKAPFSEGKPYQTENLQKYLILMTDGENTENRFLGNQSSIDNRTEAVCANIKALPQNTANDPPTPAITVWSIRVMDGNEALLKNCATDASKYINVTDPNQLYSVFSAIGSEIANLHLSK
jgi:Flp pilus assembly protein TadG